MQKYHWLGGGLWIIPLLTFLGSAWAFYRAYRASRSGSTQQDPATGKSIVSDQNVPIYKLGQFYFGCGLLLATIVILLVMYGDR